MLVTVESVSGPTVTVAGVVDYNVTVVAALGSAGSSGGTITAGPGFQIVGNELRYNLQSLTRG